MGAIGLSVKYLPQQDPELPCPTDIKKLFYEFMYRYEALRAAKRQQLLWLLLAVVLGPTLLLLPWFVPNRQIWLSLLILGLFNLAIHQYFQSKSLVRHAYVNAHILHHHLVGRIEVGFCLHGKPCTCAEDFRHYVWQKYRISLYSNRFEVNL